MSDFAFVIVGLAALLCAIQAMRTPRLLVAAIWLAGTSAMVSILLYLMGAHQLAVVELSVGAGLVTILFVFAISIVGEELNVSGTAVSPWVAGIVVFAAVGILAWLLIPARLPLWESITKLTFNARYWQDRYLDILVQMPLLFAGVLGILGLLSEESESSRKE